MSSQLMAEQTNLDRLVRYCQCLVGDQHAADDIAQETLIAAWRQQGNLRDVSRHDQWLFGIARNLCRRWIRTRKQAFAWQLDVGASCGSDVPFDIDLQQDPIDLEIELEKHELAELLDRALAELPPLTRTVLIERYIHDRPQAEIARRLRTSEGAVEARIQRGKLSLHRTLTTQFQSEAAAYGLFPERQGQLQETRIWCPNCGNRHLMGYLDSNQPHLALRMWCPRCGANLAIGDVPGLFNGIHGFRAALSRFARWHHHYFQHALASRQAVCLRCGRVVPLLLETQLGGDQTLGCTARCPSCVDWAIQADAAALALSLPAAQAFWRKHQRIATSPIQLIEAHGTSALLITLQDVRGAAKLELVMVCDTLTPLSV